MSQPTNAEYTLPSSPGRKLTLLPLVMILFFSVSGGAYGLEDLVGSSGPGMALLLIMITPIIWSLPSALMVAELSTAMPAPGGYYAWVKRALGPFWGFQEGWWSWVTSFVDMAIYPVLFADYLNTLLIQQFGFKLLEENELAHWAVTLVVIWSFVLVNIRGSKGVGEASKYFGLFVLVPFGVMSVLGLFQLVGNPVAFWTPFIPEESTMLGAFGTGLFVVMWNYLGWDSVSTVTEDIHQPKKTFPRALALAIPLITLCYLLPVGAGLQAAPDWSLWTAGYFPEVAALVGGSWLGAWMAIGGLVSAAALFNALMLSISRLPYFMAEDGYLPQAITKRHAKYDTPYIAIAVCASIYSFFTLSAFASLVVVDVIVYSAALILEFAALIALRINEPNMKRPVRVPGGWPGIIIVTALPCAVLALAVYSTWVEEGAIALYMSAAAIMSGPILYPFLKKYVKKDRPSVPVEIEYEDGTVSVR